jgi:hypothetical protein
MCSSGCTSVSVDALWALMAERTGKPRGAALILPPVGMGHSLYQGP